MTDDTMRYVRATRRAALILAGSLSGAVAAFRLSPLAGEAKKKPKRKTVRLVAPNMIGANEVPGPGDNGGSALASFTIKANGEICVRLLIESLSDGREGITLVHIHKGAEGASGDPVIDFSELLPARSGCVSASKSLLNKIKANPAGFYANIHTTSFGAGAVRDQLQKA